MAAFKFLSSYWCPQMSLCKRASESSDLLVWMCVKERERKTERLKGQERERKNLSECVLLRHHTLRPKESMPGAVWEDFILHIEEAIQVMGCVCLRVYVCQVVLVSLRMHTSVPGLLFSQTQVVHFNFVNLTNILSLICTDSVKGTKIDRKDKLSV